MKNIIFYARLVKIVAYLLMPAIIIGFFIKWLSPEIGLSDPHLFGLFLSYTFDDYSTIGNVIPAMPFMNRIIGMLFDGVVYGLAVTILWLITEIMKRLENNEPFSSSIVHLFTFISKCAFCLAIYTPVNRTILSVVTTLHVRPHTLSISFGSADLFNIFIFGFFMIMTLLMQQATALQQEQSLTV